MIGTVFIKGQFSDEDYATCANWCNENNATIVDHELYYECVKIPDPTFEELKERKLKTINSKCNEILRQAVSSYPDTEIQTFDQQVSEAEKYLETLNTDDCPLLNGISKARGIELDDLVERVLRKRNAFSELSGYIIGIRQKYEDLLDECKTTEEINSLVVDFVVPDFV